VLVTDLNL